MRNPHSETRIPWYAVFPRDDENVRGMYLERYGIRQVNRTFIDFMVELDEALDFIPDPWNSKNIKSIEGLRSAEITSCTAAVPKTL
jgi:hypothetical protein